MFESVKSWWKTREDQRLLLYKEAIISNALKSESTRNEVVRNMVKSVANPVVSLPPVKFTDRWKENKIVKRYRRELAARKYIESKISEEQRGQDNLEICLWSLGLVCNDFSVTQLKLMVLHKNRDLFSDAEVAALKQKCV